MSPDLIGLRIIQIFTYQTLFYTSKKETDKKGCGILIYLKNDIKFKIIEDFSDSDGNHECVTVETEKKKSKKLLITCCYRPPIGAIKGLNSFLENVFKKTYTENKLCFVVCDSNINCLDYNENLKIRTFYNRIFAHGCISLITRPTRVTSKTVSLIDNIFTNFIFDTSLKPKKGIIKSDFPYHFPSFVSLSCGSKMHKENQKINIHKRVMHDTNFMAFKTDLHNFNWNSINHSPETNSKYEIF